MAVGRRYLGSVPALTRKAWESAAQPLEDFLRRLWDSEANGIPSGFNDVVPTEVAAPIGTGIGGPGEESSGWAAADHRHVAQIDLPSPIGIEEGEAEGTSTALVRADHRHELRVYRTIGVTVDASPTAVVSTGVKGYIAVPYSGTIVGWKLEADQVGSCVVDAWKSRRVPTVADSICGGAKPGLSSAETASGTTVGWSDTTVLAGDVVAFNVDSASTLTLLTVLLKVREVSLGF